MALTPRGIRNKNPGNIRRGETAWKGLAPQQTDPAFCQFISMPYGIRAIARCLLTYQAQYKLGTVREIINRWAPPIENDTKTYAENVAREIGVQPDDLVNFLQVPTLRAAIRGIIKQENGRLVSMLVPDSTINEGISLL